MNELSADNVAISFGRRRLFGDVSLRLGEGASMAVTGPNGSGKSTLLKVLAGLLTPSKGSVALTMNGAALDDEARRHAITLAAPYVNLYESLSLRENLEFVARLRGLEDPADRIEEAITFYDLRSQADEHVRLYSSGMKQRSRLALARVVSNPCMLLDEPFTNLDESGRTAVRTMAASFVEQGGIMVVASNSDEEIAICDSRLDIRDYV